MNVDDIYLLEWTFTPADYFEEEVNFDCELGTIHVDQGKAEARISPDNYPTDHSTRNQLHAELDAIFMGAQLISHKTYTLSKPNLSILHSDGRKDTHVFAEASMFAVSGMKADIVVTGRNGMIQDTKRERIDERVKLSHLSAKYISDPVANSILRSYAAAVNDPNNELVHLYEIRDALSKHFGGEQAAISAIGITALQWSRLGKLANNEPLTQGRHRGRQLGTLRDATDSELIEARDIARKMVKGYLVHCDAI